MRIILVLCLVGALVSPGWGQSPPGINYQGVARDAEGKALASRDISVRISILKESANGDTEFAETHEVTTNSFGLFTLVIGKGTATTGSFQYVSWAIGNKWLQIEMDPAGGNSFQLLGSQQLMSVPYAFYSTYSGNGLTAGEGIKIQNNQITYTGDADNSTSNELITDVSFGADKKLKITEAGVTKEADLSSLLGASQNLSNVLAINNDAGGQKITNLASPLAGSDAATKSYVDVHVDNDADATNELQNLLLTGNILNLSGDASSINLAPYLDNTDSQNLSLTAAGTNRTISISGGTGITIDVADNDNSISNELQDLILTGNTLSLSGDATTINLAPYLDNTDNQDLTLSGNSLSLTNDASPVNLAPYLDNTDNQNLSLSSAGTNRTISITGGAGVIVDVADNDNSIINEIQDLSLAGNTLSLSSDATPVNLGPYLDNTDNQDLVLTGNSLNLTNDGTPVNLSAYLDNTDNQDLTLTGNTLSLSNDATNVNLAPYLQTLTYTSATNNLAISGGNNVTISTNLNQVLTAGADAGAHQINNLLAPTGNNDAATKGYTDNAIATAIATNYAFKTTYSFINSGGIFTDSPIALAEAFDDFNVVATNKFTAPSAGTYLFTVTGSSLLGGIPVKLKVTSGAVSYYDVKRQAAYPVASVINYMDSNIFKLNAGDTVEVVVTSALLGERVDGILFGYKL